MIKRFADNKSIIVLLIPLFVIIHLFLGRYLFPFQNITLGQENLWLINFNHLSAFLSALLTFIFLCGNAILLNYVFNNFDYYERLNFLPSFFYILLIFLFPISFNFCEDLVAHTFFILAFSQLLHIHQNEDARNYSFLAGLFIGIATTFLPEYSLLIVISYFVLFIIRPFVFREHILPLLGFAFPFMWVYLINPHFFNDFLRVTSFLAYSPSEQLEFALAGMLVFVLFIHAYRQIIKQSGKSSIRHKKIMTITSFTFFYALAITILVSLVFKTYFYFTILIVILPIILSFSYLNKKPKWFPETLIYLIVLINILKFLY